MGFFFTALMYKFDITCSIVLFKNEPSVSQRTIQDFLASELEVRLYLVDNSPTAELGTLLEPLQNPSPTILEIEHDGIFIIGVAGKKGHTMDNNHKHYYDESDVVSLVKKYNFSLLRFLYGPALVKSEMLSRTLSQYCVYGASWKG